MMTHPADWTGQQLADGRYTGLTLLGQGGMADVYKARDTQRGQDVAIKVPRRALVEDAGFAARFEREVRSLQKLQHTHIVRVHGLGQHEELPFLVLAYLAGGSLQQYLPDAASAHDLPAPRAEQLGWLPPVAAALDFIHGRDYVHRDVKPTNILFDAQGQVFLSDFGIVKALRDPVTVAPTIVTTDGCTLGTPEYMAPEQLQGKPLDGRADQYALAVTVYELLTGRCPFIGSMPAYLLFQHLQQEAPPVAELRPSAGSALSEVLRRGLAEAPADRFPSCAAFAQAVLDALPRPAVSVNTAAKAQTRTNQRGAEPIAPAGKAEVFLPMAPSASPPQLAPVGKGSPLQRRIPLAFLALLLTASGLGGWYGHTQYAGRMERGVQAPPDKEPAPTPAHSPDALLAKRPVRDEPQMVIVSSDGAGHYRSITAALTVVAPGSRILVRPGRYEESLAMDKPVEIVGDGPRAEVILQGQAGPGLVVRAVSGLVRGLTIRGAMDRAAPESPAVEIAAGRLTLEDCEVSRATGAGIFIHGPDTGPLLRNCRIQTNGQAGIRLTDRAAATVEDCQVQDNATANDTYSGIGVRGQGKAIVRRCTISANQGTGVTLLEASTAVISDCDISDNKFSGVHAIDAQGSVRNCDLRSNGTADDKSSAAGIWIERSEKANGTSCKWEVTDCRIHQSKAGCFGVWMGKPGVQVTLVHCDIRRHSLSGVVVRREAHATLRNCQVADNGNSGVLVEEKAVCSLSEGCSISGNGHSGIYLRGGSRATIKACRIGDNNTCGVQALEASGSLEDCDIYANGNPNLKGDGAGLWIAQGEKADGAPYKWEVKNCRIREGKGGCFGVAVLGPGNGAELFNCDIHKHSWSGVIAEREATLHLHGCRIGNNGGDGVLLAAKASGSLDDGCVLSGNLLSGIEVREESKVTVTDCRMAHNREGIRVCSKASGIVTNCDLRGNNQARDVEADCKDLVKLENNKE